MPVGERLLARLLSMLQKFGDYIVHVLEHSTTTEAYAKHIGKEYQYSHANGLNESPYRFQDNLSRTKPQQLYNCSHIAKLTKRFGHVIFFFFLIFAIVQLLNVGMH